MNFNSADAPARRWQCADLMLDYADKPLVMGVLNVTPDSFSDGGEHASLNGAVEWAHRMKREGADIIDVGGESTRPGAQLMPLALERSRVIPVVKVLAAEGFIVSIDTSKPEIMREAAENGAKILNDTRGFTLPGALEAAVSTGCGLAVMHWADVKTLGTGAELEQAVFDWLLERRRDLIKTGAAPECIALDPGLGFGKRPEQSFALLAALPELAGAGAPVLVGISRKKSLSWALGRETEPKERDAATAAVSLLAADRGAAVVRVHDVHGTADALAVRAALLSLKRR